jgi:hypothetical protein
MLANAGVMLLGQIEGADTTDWRRRMIELKPGAVGNACARDNHVRRDQTEALPTARLSCQL